MEMVGLKYTFPFDFKKALKSGFFVSGTSGSGKTNLAFCLVDRLMEEGVVVYVFDPSQAWRKKSNIPYWVRVVPGEYTLKLPAGKSVIFDISELYVKEQREFVQQFCRTLFASRVSKGKDVSKEPWIFLIFEEAQLYVPQSAMRSKAFQEVMRIITVGRNFRIRFGLITQFASTVDKLCVKMTEQRYFGKSDELNDIKYLQNFVGEKTKLLPDLKIGEFLYDFGNKTEKIKTPLFQSGTTPSPLSPAVTLTSTDSKPQNFEADRDVSMGLLIIFLAFIIGGLIVYGIMAWGRNATGMFVTIYQQIRRLFYR